MSQKLSSQPIPSSYHIIKVGEIKCVTTKLGEYLNIMPQESTMPIIQNQLLKQLLIEASHRSFIRMPKEKGNINIEIHNNGLVTENKLKRATLLVFIPDAYHLVNKLINKCLRCNSAKGRPYNLENINFENLLKQHTLGMFSCISCDTIPITLKALRSNHEKKHQILVILCCLTECLEYILLEDGKESSKLIALLTLHQHYNPIRYIITDQGSNFQNLEITGRTNPNGEPQRILRLLETAVQSGAQNQKSNKVESSIKKKKMAIKTIGNPKFLEICKTVRPNQFALLLAFIKSSLEASP